MPDLSEQVKASLLKRNAVSRRVFGHEAMKLAHASKDMASRFSRGGRLIAVGIGAGVTDAQHVAVEFVHPVIVGKRALPSMDLSLAYAHWIPAIVRPDDILTVFGPSTDDELVRVVQLARSRGVLTIDLWGGIGDVVIGDVDDDPFIRQEIAEIAYHVLWETVHVFLEHAGNQHDVGRASSLYPFLTQSQDTRGLLPDVAASIRAKADEDEALRLDIVTHDLATIVTTAEAIHARLASGGKLLIFGNGGSATDATDWAFDCVASPKGHRVIPALSLSVEPATITALSNDVGNESIFLRQLIAHASAKDVAIGITTSGASANILAALCEARKRGLLSVALVGYGGGEILKRNLVDHGIVVRSDYIPRIQEVQASVYHIILDTLQTLHESAG
jgi:D-sedoheptulose 7-phosphate isomerase